MRTLQVLVALLLTTIAVAACDGGGGGDEPDPDRSRARLEQQRVDARAAAAGLVEAAERALPGARFNPGGLYRGCEAGGPEHYRSVRYEFHAGVRVAATAEPRPFTARLTRALRSAGFEPGAPDEDRDRVLVGGTRGDLTATLSDFPDAAPDRIGLRVLGPCVDIPEGQSDEWLRRDDTEPLEK